MSTKTAQHWLGPDEQFDSVELDYAIVGRPALEVKHATNIYDTQTFDWDDSEDDPATFGDLIERTCRGCNCYRFGCPHSQLVFADVDQADPSHEKNVREALARPKLSNENDKTLEIRNQYIDWTVKKSLDRDEDISDDEDWPEEKRKFAAERKLQKISGALPYGTLAYILGKEKDEQNELLMLFSGQTKLTSQRPVFVLVNLIDTAQTSALGETKGYMTAFDVLENRLIIKPFFSKEGHHPLGDKWLDSVADDGISFIGTPAELLTKYLDFAKAADTKDSLTDSDGFTFFIWGDVIDWISKEFSALSKTGQITMEQLDEASALSDSLLAKLEKLKFPKKEISKPDPKDHLDRGMEFLLEGLENMQFELRHAAVKAKNDGKEQKAEKAAEVYEKVKESLEEYKKVS